MANRNCRHLWAMMLVIVDTRLMRCPFSSLTSLPQVPPLDFKILGRIHYLAPCDHKGTVDADKWGEHEVDYILFYKGEVDVYPNPDEVCAIDYVSQARLR